MPRKAHHVERRERHGRYGTPEYRAWCSIKTRCYNPSFARYADYGGRGITVCERWLRSFVAFLDDMGPRPSPSHSIDRIDGAKGYEPGNCRWATVAEQARNRALCQITHDGRTQTIGDWARELGITTKTIRVRRRAGLTMDQVLRPATPRGERWQSTGGNP